MHIDHIGIAVKDLEAAVKTYETILGRSCSKREIVESEKVETAFFETGQSKVELLGARGEGLHHLAFEVKDIYAELDRLREKGFTVLNEQPKDGADNKLVAFVHPKNNNGVLVELCQSKRD